jgi:hypothetical protein
MNERCRRHGATIARDLKVKEPKFRSGRIAAPGTEDRAYGNSPRPQPGRFIGERLRPSIDAIGSFARPCARFAKAV